MVSELDGRREENDGNRKRLVVVLNGEVREAHST
jgi:hypothetical protein